MRVWRAVARADRYLGAIFLFSLIFLIILDTLFRAFYLTPFMGTMELVRCFLIWSVFVALRYVTSENAHIQMSELVAHFPVPVQRVLRVVCHLTTLAVFALITISFISTTISNFRDTTPTLEIPLVLFFLPTIFGFLLATIQSGILLVAVLREP